MESSLDAAKPRYVTDYSFHTFRDEIHAEVGGCLTSVRLTFDPSRHASVTLYLGSEKAAAAYATAINAARAALERASAEMEDA